MFSILSIEALIEYAINVISAITLQCGNSSLTNKKGEIVGIQERIFRAAAVTNSIRRQG